MCQSVCVLHVHASHKRGRPDLSLIPAFVSHRTLRRGGRALRRSAGRERLRTIVAPPVWTHPVSHAAIHHEDVDWQHHTRSIKSTVAGVGTDVPWAQMLCSVGAPNELDHQISLLFGALEWIYRVATKKEVHGFLELFVIFRNSSWQKLKIDRASSLKRARHCPFGVCAN